MKYFFDRVDVVIAPTTLMKNLLEQYGIIKPMHIIPTGLTRSDFRHVDRKAAKRNSDLVKKFPIIKNKRILVVAGRVGKEKNLLFILDVFQKIKSSYDDIILMFVGDGPFKEELMGIVKERKMTKDVIFSGIVQKSNMRNVYAISHILLFASKVETQGLVTIEAMSCGAPVVAIGEMGTREVMNGDNGGFMVNDSIDEFTEKVKLLLDNQKLYDKKVKEAFKYAENWTIDKFSAKLNKIYYNIIADRLAK